jgi:hypothetical protein
VISLLLPTDALTDIETGRRLATIRSRAGDEGEDIVKEKERAVNDGVGVPVVVAEKRRMNSVQGSEN